MEAYDREEIARDADELLVPPNGPVNEMQDVGQEDNMQGQVCSCEKL